MKKYFKYILGLVIPVLLVSCLKDKELVGPKADGAVENLIEFKNIQAPNSSVSSTYRFFNRSYGIVPSVDLALPIQIAGVYNPSGDIKVEVEIDNSILEVYNEENGTSLVPLQASNYKVSTYSITIPKGQKTADFVVNLSPDKFDFDNNYALGFKIKSVSEGVISGNFGSIIVGIGAKNRLDGVFKLTGTLRDVTGSSFQHVTIPYGAQYGDYLVNLETVSGNKVILFDVNIWEDYLYPMYSGGWSGYGSFCPIFEFDPATNKIISVTNYYGQPAGNTRSAQLDPSGVNTYDPETGIMKVKYFMIQPSIVPEAPSIRAYIDETYKFEKSR